MSEIKRSGVFSYNEDGLVNICLPQKPHQLIRPWLKESLDFAIVCLPFINALDKKSPIALSGLPIDFSLSICLSAWFLGRTVAFVDPELTAIQQVSIIKTLKPSCWLSHEPIKTTETANTLVININSEVGSDTFSQALASDSDTNIPTGSKSHKWKPGEVAIILFTSGSTGEPKGVCHSLQNLILSAELFKKHFEVSPQDYILNLAGLHTMSGLRCSIFMPLTVYCDTQLSPISGNLTSVIHAIEHNQSSILIAGPKLLETLTPISTRITGFVSLRMILSTGAPLSRSARKALWEKIAVPAYDYYGLTETTGLVIAEATSNYKPLETSIGFPVSGIKTVVVDEKGQEHSQGDGLLRIYSPTIFLGYLGQTSNKADFFDTGDNATIVENGAIFLHGRADKSIKSTSTLWLKPQAITSKLNSLTAVKDFAIKTSHQQINCYIVSSNITFNELIEDIITDLGTVYREVKWHEVNEIPRTNLSKVNWNLLEK